MICTTCQTEVADGAKFCLECGTPLMLRCPGCGAQHAPAQKFCAECGTALAASPAAAPRPIAEPAAALVFEDMQWADVGLLDFIEQLLDWSAGSPIFILTLARRSSAPDVRGGRRDGGERQRSSSRRTRQCAAEGRDETVEADFGAAIDGSRALGYPYWLAVAQTDLADWLVDRHRDTEAAPLLEEAIATLGSLGAAPALARALEVGRSLTGAVVS